MYTLDFLSPYTLVAAGGAWLFAVLLGWQAVRPEAAGGRLRTWLLCAGVGLPLLLFVYAVCTLAINVPISDDYDAFLAYFVRTPPERVTHLFAFHNEHRIFFVRALAEAIYAGCGSFDFRCMILAGNALFLTYAWLIFARLNRHGLQVAAWVIPIAWALLSILMYENMLWALTSVQSNSVLLFAWLALLCLERRRQPVFFVLALGAAILCTYTSGGGLFVWFCMAGMLLKQACAPAGDAPREARWPAVARAAVFAVVAAVSIACYLRGFPSQEGRPLQAALQHPLNVLAYAAFFCGAPLQFPALAFPAGVVVGLLAGLLLLRTPRIRDDVTFFFLAFLLCAVASASIFRSSLGIDQGLSFRYRVIAVSIWIAVAVLVHEQFPRLREMRLRWAAAGLIALSVFLNLSAYLLAYPQLVTRRDRFLEGIRCWPADETRLVHPEPAKASKILRDSVARGTYVMP
jgi:hypothetical protein